MSRQPAWKKIAYEKACEEIYEIEDLGHEVLRLTDYHWKINGIDVWPSSKKYMVNGIVKTYQESIKEIL